MWLVRDYEDSFYWIFCIRIMQTIRGCSCEWNMTSKNLTTPPSSHIFPPFLSCCPHPHTPLDFWSVKVQNMFCSMWESSPSRTLGWVWWLGWAVMIRENILSHPVNRAERKGLSFEAFLAQISGNWCLMFTHFECWDTGLFVCLCVCVWVCICRKTRTLFRHIFRSWTHHQTWTSADWGDSANGC